MYQKKQTEKKIFHMQKGSGLFLTGLFCLFLAFWSGKPENISAASGGTSLNNHGSYSQNFWYGKGVPSQGKYWQQVTVDGGVNYGANTPYGLSNKVFDENYPNENNLYINTFYNLDGAAIEESKFYLSDISMTAKATSSSFPEKQGIVSMQQNQTESWEGDLYEDENHWLDSANDYRYYYSVYYTPWSGFDETYYRVITDDTEAVNLSEEFFEFYKNKSDITWLDGTDKGVYTDNTTCFSEAVVYSGDSPSKIRALYTEFIENYQLTKYETGTEIPLYQDGKNVVRIEMITLCRYDYYGVSYTYSNVTQDDGSVMRTEKGYNHVDVDFVFHTGHNYEFSYQEKTKLEEPTATNESGITGNSLQVSLGESIFLNNSSNNPSDVMMEYYLSNQVITDQKDIKAWSTYDSAAGAVLNGEKYLYARTAPGDSSRNQYRSSELVRVELSYLSVSAADITATPDSGGYIDVGMSVALKVKEDSADAAKTAILYTFAEQAPSFEKVPAKDRAGLDNQVSTMGAGEILLKDENYTYVKLNGLWYRSSDTTLEQYSENNQPKAEESIRSTGYLVLYAQAIEEGKTPGPYTQIRYMYGLSSQTQAPSATPETDNEQPAEVTMLQEIRLSGAVDSKIFYTLNGSMPSVTIEGTQLIPGNGTYLYEKPIVVSENFAVYGKNFTIMAQAVTYDEEGYQTKSDSEVVRFTYQVASQNAVVPVTSIPSTSAESPTEMKVGSAIQLYSKTEGVTIFYTLDGSEPVFNSNTGEVESESTYLYDGTKGIIVEEPTDSSQLIITAVACRIGMATSEISRMIYQYPDTVASPYATPGTGAVVEGTEVVLKSSTENALIYYEIAYGKEVPKDPTNASHVFHIDSPIKITQDTNIKAIAELDGMYSTVTTFSYKMSSKLSAPKASIETGMMVPSGTVLSLSADSGTTVHYTMDGSDPKDKENKGVLVGNSIILSGDPGAVIILRAYASKDGYSDSETVNYSYSISAYEGGIYANLESGSVVRNGDVIVLNTDMTGAKIYYTTDGSTPTEDSHYGRTVTINGEPGKNITIMAMAVASGTQKSNSYAIFTYQIVEKLSAPTASVPTGAIFTKESSVALTVESGKIYYTIDGTDPTTASEMYRNPIPISGTVEIRAIAASDEFEVSDVSIFKYGFAEQVAAPTASYASGELEMGTKIKFDCETEGATIYYRTDGGELNLSKKNELEIYKEPITVNQATNFKVIAVKDKMQDSKVLTVGYTVREPIVIETPEEEVSAVFEEQSTRLQSRRSFSDTESGPSYRDVILRNAAYGAVVAAEGGNLPENVQLRVESTNVTDAIERRVKQVISENFGVVASYDLTLLVNGEEVQPENTIEIGLPIPVEYENAMIYIVHVQEDGNIELFETRRSGGVAYAKVDHLSVFSITAPVEFVEEEAAFNKLPIAYSLGVAMTGLGIWLIYKARKAKREDGMQDE